MTENGQNRVLWTDLELSIQYTIFSLLRQRCQSDTDVASNLGLSKLELDSILEKVNLKTIYPADSDHIRQYCEAAGCSVTGPNSAALMDHFQDYLVFASAYESATEVDVVRGKAFLRQCNLDDDLLDVVEDDGDHKRRSVCSRLAQRPMSSRCDIRKDEECLRSEDTESDSTKVGAPQDGHVTHRVKSLQLQTHIKHNPSRFASHFQDPYFPRTIRQHMLSTDPSTMTDVELWLMYGNEAEPHAYSGKVGKSTYQNSNADNEDDKSGGINVLATKNTDVSDLQPQYFQDEAISKLLQLRSKCVFSSCSGTEAGSLSPQQFKELASSILRDCNHEQQNFDSSQHVKVVDQPAIVGSPSITPPRPAWSPISDEDGTYGRESKDIDKARNVSTENTQGQHRGPSFVMTAKVAKPRMKRGPYKKTRERLVREQAARAADSETPKAMENMYDKQNETL